MKRKQIIWWAGILAGLLFTAGFQALKANPTYQQQIQGANSSYQNGNFENALEQYLSVYEAGMEAPELLLNIGNTYFKLNDIPAAILFYERALRLSPRDEDIRFNLGLAQSRIIDKIEEVPQVFFIRWWHMLRDSFPIRHWARFSLIGLLLTLTFTAIYLISRRLWVKQLFFWVALISLAVTLHAILFAHQQRSNNINKPEAIIFTPTVTVKSSPDDGSTDLFVIHEGTKVRITDNIGDWMEIRISSGSKGWIKNTDLEKI
ncbi:MAG: tetratricopeptide repeat protein [Lentimicrobiaceae bacterium]|nr:tetratricopeptide repeat protein [Lentimicrobiaceae bacterium]